MTTDLTGLGNRPSDTRVDRVVVCVCTKDRPIMLHRCLDSLLRQRVSDGSLDLHLLIVDNSAHGGVRETVRQYGDGSLPIAYVHEPRAGIPVARNAALSALEHISPDWIAFIDDDEIAQLHALRDDLTECIGCGCLSLKVCHLTNPRDVLGRDGAGARRLPTVPEGPAARSGQEPTRPTR